jgi:hypothetical protein
VSTSSVVQGRNVLHSIYHFITLTDSQGHRFLNKNGWNGFGTDARLVVYPFLLGTGWHSAATYLSQKMSAADVCKAVTADLDAWIQNNGWYKVAIGDLSTWPTSTPNFGGGVTAPPTFGGADPRTIPASNVIVT